MVILPSFKHAEEFVVVAVIEIFTPLQASGGVFVSSLLLQENNDKAKKPIIVNADSN
jgi:hypothetical protein